MLEYVVIKTSVAMEVGTNAAILLQNIHYWVEKNKANNINLHDGKYWTYNSIKAFSALFPFLTPKIVRTALKKLKTDGWILTGNYNKQGTDKTCWYTLTEKAISLMGTSMCPNRQIEVPKWANGSDQKGLSSYIQNNTTKEYQKESRANAPEDCSPKLAEAMNNFAQMRKAIKKPMTDRAKQLMLNKLEKLAGSDDDLKIAILDQSIENSWAGVYPLKDNNRQVKNNKPESTSDVYNDGMAALKRMGLLDNESE